MKGFSVIETIVALAVFSILFTLSVPVYSFLLRSYEFKNAESLTSMALRKAQYFSRSSFVDSSWSVHFADKDILIYKGEDFLNRDTSYDNVYNVGIGTSFGNSDDISFEKGTGNTQSGYVDIYSYDLYKRININEKGVLY